MSGPARDVEREEAFWRVKPHRDAIRDIRQMQDNLDGLESVVRDAEWLALGGRGHFDVERAERLCEGVEDSMPHILESIRELPARNGRSEDDDRDE